MIRLVRFFVERWVFSLSIFLAIVFFGLNSGTRLGIDLLPEFEFPIVAVNTLYPGAGSQEMVEQVSQPIEDALATLPGVSDISSFSNEGFSFVVAQFNYGVGVDQAATDVKQRVDTILDALPDDAGQPSILKFDPNDQPILNIAVAAPGKDIREVQRLAEDRLEPPLQQVEGVADVAVIGPVAREIQVLLDPAELSGYGLTPAQVAAAIGAASVTLPAGSLSFDEERILIAVRSAPTSAEEVAALTVDPVRGLKVSDVARVRDTASTPTTFVRLNGQPVVVLEVRKVSGANAVATARGLRAALNDIPLPEGYSLEIIGDTTVFIENSVIDTFRETLLAVLAVALVVLLFVGRLGSTFSVILAIPITMTGAVMIFGVLDYSFNTVTLLAITVAVGLVVDDSIVIAENIERYRRLGYGLKEAVFRGAGEVAVPVLTATLSLLAVFIPIAFLPGIIGQFFSQFGLSLAATIAVSYLEAMFFLTVRLAYMPNPLPPNWHDVRQAPGKFITDLRWAFAGLREVWFWLMAAALSAALILLQLPLQQRLGVELPLVLERPQLQAILVGAGLFLGVALALFPLLFLLRYVGRLVFFTLGAVLRNGFEATDYLVERARNAYGSSLRFLLGRSTLVLVVAGALVASLFVIFPRIKFNFVSDVDVSIVQVNVQLPPGTPLGRTDLVSDYVEARLRELPEARAVQATVGTGGILGNADTSRAEILVELRDLNDRRRSSFEIAESLKASLLPELADAYPEATTEIFSSDGGAVPVETGIELTLLSTNLDLLNERDGRAREIMRQHEGLENVGSSLEGAVSERVFNMDSAALAGTGLTPSEVGNTLRAYNVGIRAANLQTEGREVPIQVKVNPVFIRDEATLLSLPIFAPALQTYLPLGELGRFEVQAAPISIDRSNQAYVATLTADLAPGAEGQFQIRRELEARFAEAGVTDEQVLMSTGVGPDLLGDLVFYGPIAFALALLLNYLVIASQFNSLKYPLYLLLSVPLSLVGALWLFYLTGRPLDVISVLGVVILIGLVTKNAILLLDVVVSQYAPDVGLAENLVRAGRLRLRPILMTAITILIISLPLLLGLGEGSEFRRPLGLVILGGVVSSTFLTLFVVPAAFYRFERHRYDREVEAKGEVVGLEPQGASD